MCRLKSGLKYCLRRVSYNSFWIFDFFIFIHFIVCCLFDDVARCEVFCALQRRLFF
jgi:hypothetical protein